MSKKSLVTLRWALASLVITAVGWAIFWLVKGYVPSVSRVLWDDGAPDYIGYETYISGLPAISRWWDVVFAPLLVAGSVQLIWHSRTFGRADSYRGPLGLAWACGLMIGPLTIGAGMRFGEYAYGGCAALMSGICIFLSVCSEEVVPGGWSTRFKRLAVWLLTPLAIIAAFLGCAYGFGMGALLLGMFILSGAAFAVAGAVATAALLAAIGGIAMFIRWLCGLPALPPPEKAPAPDKSLPDGQPSPEAELEAAVRAENEARVKLEAASARKTEAIARCGGPEQAEKVLHAMHSRL